MGGGVKLGRNFGKIPAVQGPFAGILPKRIPRSAGLIPGLCKWKSQYPRYFPAPRGPWLQMTGALDWHITPMMDSICPSFEEDTQDG